ncbi:S46 family peptidase [Pseudoalteromonas xiamenensis]|uniref:S46 family peptidase n=1 Tax=Pseudoalteromonas xiamenensis TaxID=882626 RepID=UPI0027E56C15|nr:S46 family peptidase [Pseudoalteromonas xiamenensis]WMN58952.1 S46 family peptidase [Pseudoalteromonas xiamenensis]
MKYTLIGLALAAVFSQHVLADEGQWQPHQLPQLQKQLTEKGIEISGEQLADLNQYPMNAIVSLGYCSASFVSPKGLVVTNHHCAYGMIQNNSTKDDNLIEKGFLAKSLDKELPAGPQERLYITESVTDVTVQISGNLAAELTGAARFDAIEANRKALIKECETDENYRCSVVSFHHGMEYFLIKQLMIQDVRLVYAPPESVGNYGGDIDNFEYPRHTGDYSFIRAYVGKDGKPAPYSEDNVPYEPKSFLKVNADGVKKGDGILLAGYPGRTSRYRLANEIQFAADWQYPAMVKTYTQIINTIDALSAENPDIKVKYASRVKSYNNRMKKLQGLLDGFKVTDIHAIKQAQEDALLAWIAANPEHQHFKTAIDGLRVQLEKEHAFTRQNYYFAFARSSDLLTTAMRLYRLSVENQKPDSERKIGYQERDLKMFAARLTRMDKSFHPTMDVTMWAEQLAEYLAQPAQTRVTALDSALELEANQSKETLITKLSPMYGKTSLTTNEGRLAWMEKTPEEFQTSDDPFIKVAVALFDTSMQLEKQEKDLEGAMSVVRPAYMNAIIAYNKSQGKPVYPDANSTLRITYGSVDGYEAKDGVYKTPFTSVRGLIAKKGPFPFNAPEDIVGAYQEGKTAGYFYNTLERPAAQSFACKIFGCEVTKPVPFNSVPVNFLSSADTTGGNSGSAVMNGKGELVGLNFDSTYESITKDWYFNPEITRAIHVDIRYVLWLMEHVHGAHNLLSEMDIVHDAK